MAISGEVSVLISCIIRFYLYFLKLTDEQSQESDPFIPPRGRKHNSPDLDALMNRYEPFVPNRGKRDKVKDLFKYDDLFYPHRGKKHRNLLAAEDDPFFATRGKKLQLRDLYNVDDPFVPNRGKRFWRGWGQSQHCQQMTGRKECQRIKLMVTINQSGHHCQRRMQWLLLGDWPLIDCTQQDQCQVPIISSSSSISSRSNCWCGPNSCCNNMSASLAIPITCASRWKQRPRTARSACGDLCPKRCPRDTINAIAPRLIH